MSEAAESGYAFVAAWEYECCGEPIRVGDVVTVRPGGEEPSVWDRPLPAPITFSGGHHDTGRVEPPGFDARVERIWEAWAPLSPLPAGGFEAGDDVRLIPCGRTSPHSGSPDAILSPVPKGARPADEHWGWVLEIRVVEPAAAAQRPTPRRAGRELYLPTRVTVAERSEDVLRELRGDR